MNAQLTSDELAQISGGTEGMSWRGIRQAAAIGGTLGFTGGAVVGGGVGALAGGMGAIPGALVGGVVGGTIGAVTAGMAAYTGQKWVVPAMDDDIRGR